jgi:hypothetical protein
MCGCSQCGQAKRISWRGNLAKLVGSRFGIDYIARFKAQKFQGRHHCSTERGNRLMSLED